MTMSNALRPIDRVSTGLLAASLVTNYVAHKTNHGTICQNTRPAFHLDTRVGKVAAVASWSALTAWFLPHYINGGK
jgi:hypothetical protein